MQDMPVELRVSLWNTIQPWIWRTVYGEEYLRRAQWVYNFRAIRWPTDEVPPEFRSHDATQRLKQWLLNSSPEILRRMRTCRR